MNGLIEAEWIGLEELLIALDAIADGDEIAQALRAAIPTLGRINQSRRDVVAQLPYSPRYIGKKKPSGRVVAGGENDKGWGIDTEAFWSDLIGNWELDALELAAFSDRAYASRLASLAEGKGASVFAEDAAYLDVVEQELGDRVEAVWNV